jgi:hypothetical protein
MCKWAVQQESGLRKSIRVRDSNVVIISAEVTERQSRLEKDKRLK